MATVTDVTVWLGYRHWSTELLHSLMLAVVNLGILYILAKSAWELWRLRKQPGLKDEDRRKVRARIAVRIVPLCLLGILAIAMLFWEGARRAALIGSELSVSYRLASRNWSIEVGEIAAIETVQREHVGRRAFSRRTIMRIRLHGGDVREIWPSEESAEGRAALARLRDAVLAAQNELQGAHDELF